MKLGLFMGATALGMLGLAATARAQPGDAAPLPVPPVYSAATGTGAADSMAIKVYRDGPREMIDLSKRPHPGSPKGYHLRVWYDFARHLVFADAYNKAPCTQAAYTSLDAPAMQDPVVLMAQSGIRMPPDAKPTATEKLGGLTCDRYTQALEPGKTMSVWLEPKTRFPVKVDIPTPAGRMVVDLSPLRFSRPDPKLLVPPKGCVVQAGTTSANGAHTETPVHTETRVHGDLGTGHGAAHTAVEPPRPSPKK